MSLTNSNKVVTEERLHEFYGEILPYLGGMPEALANKFSKGDLYSTNEKIVGCYTDGKPIYQKTFTGTLPTNDTEFFISIGASISYAWVKDANYINSSKVCFSYPGIVTADYTSAFAIRILTNAASSNQNKISVKCKSQGTYYITLCYTKTTDSANSFKFGNENDYSTAERIVGTWIDGKYIYQKTINVTLPSSAGTETYTNIGVSVDKVIGQRCVFYRDGLSGAFGHNLITSSTFGTTNSGLHVIVYANASSSNKNTINVKNASANSWGESGCSLYVTIQYTKIS